MATVKEVKLLKDGAMVTPKVIADSVRLADGTKLIDKMNETFKNVPPVKWTAISQNFATYAVRSIAYGNGLYVASGSSTMTTSFAMYSYDGIEWHTSPSSIPALAEICYANGKFVGAAYGGVYYSEDGINWSQCSGDTFGDLTDICYGNGTFVVCGSLGNLGYSTDGLSFTRNDIGNYVGPNKICYANGLFVGTNSKSRFRSTDGRTWEVASGTGIVSDICYGDGIFVAGGYTASPYNSSIEYSTDGINWTSLSTDTIGANGIQRIAYGNGKFVVAYGTSGAMAYSTDAVNWVLINQSVLTNKALSLGYYNGRFIVGTENGQMAYSQVALS